MPALCCYSADHQDPHGSEHRPSSEPFSSSWHGVFTAVGIAAGVYLGALARRAPGLHRGRRLQHRAGRRARGHHRRARDVRAREPRAVRGPVARRAARSTRAASRSTAPIIGGVLGARRLRADPHGCRSRAASTPPAFGLLLGMAIGRIGDLINGEHVAKRVEPAVGGRSTRTRQPGTASQSRRRASRRAPPRDDLRDDRRPAHHRHHGVPLREALAAPSRHHVLHGRRALLGDALRRQLPAHRQRRRTAPTSSAARSTSSRTG